MTNILLTDGYVEKEISRHLLRDSLTRLPLYRGNLVSQ